jgi:hypothetical protein
VHPLFKLGRHFLQQLLDLVLADPAFQVLCDFSLPVGPFLLADHFSLECQFQLLELVFQHFVDLADLVQPLLAYITDLSHLEFDLPLHEFLLTSDQIMRFPQLLEPRLEPSHPIPKPACLAFNEIKIDSIAFAFQNFC